MGLSIWKRSGFPFGAEGFIYSHSLSALFLPLLSPMRGEKSESAEENCRDHNLKEKPLRGELVALHLQGASLTDVLRGPGANGPIHHFCRLQLRGHLVSLKHFGRCICIRVLGLDRPGRHEAHAGDDEEIDYESSAVHGDDRF